MAMFPCSADGARYRGPSSAMYPAVVIGRESTRAHLRLCTPHFQQLEQYCREHLEQVIYDQPESMQTQLLVCGLCGGQPDATYMVFVTAYPQGQEERQYFGRLCSRCAPRFHREMLLPV